MLQLERVVDEGLVALTYQSNNGPTSSSGSAMKPSTDVTARITTVLTSWSSLVPSGLRCR